MKQIFAIIAGFACFILFVVQPLRANLIASLANSILVDQASKSVLLEYASQIDPCSSNILNALGESYVLANNIPMAAHAFGKAMACAPLNPLYRYKYGEALLFMNEIYGATLVNEAHKLEPHNPLYKSENERLTKLLSQYQ